MSNKFWAADGDYDRQTAFAISPPGNAAGAGDEAGSAAETAGDQASRVVPFPASLAPTQKVGSTRYASFRPQLEDAEALGRDGDADDYSRFGGLMADNLNNNC